jgi:hypothetical protein
MVDDIVEVLCAGAVVLRLAASFEMAKAGGLWTDYGLMLMVAAAIFAVLAAFKNYAERQNTKIVAAALGTKTQELCTELSRCYHCDPQDGHHANAAANLSRASASLY